jgi:hypothetical protein
VRRFFQEPTNVTVKETATRVVGVILSVHISTGGREGEGRK